MNFQNMPENREAVILLPMAYTSNNGILHLFSDEDEGVTALPKDRDVLHFSIVID
jgi:hypothetical protein